MKQNKLALWKKYLQILEEAKEIVIRVNGIQNQIIFLDSVGIINSEAGKSLINEKEELIDQIREKSNEMGMYADMAIGDFDIMQN